MTIWMEAHKISLQLNKIGDHKICDSGDMMVLICHMAKQGFQDSGNG